MSYTFYSCCLLICICSLFVCYWMTCPPDAIHALISSCATCSSMHNFGYLVWLVYLFVVVCYLSCMEDMSPMLLFLCIHPHIHLFVCSFSLSYLFQLSFMFISYYFMSCLCWLCYACMLVVCCVGQKPVIPLRGVRW